MFDKLKINNKKNNFLFSFLVIINIVLCVFIFQFIFFRIDATPEKVYSLSDYSKEVINNIPDRINITYYFSPVLETRFPGILTISGILNEFAQVSRDKISVVNKNPANQTNEKEAISAGLIPQQFQSYDSTEVVYHTVYSGIVIEYQGKQVSIPVILSSDNLEYQMISSILSLVYPREKAIGIIDGTRNFNSDYSYLKEWLLQIQYNVVLLSDDNLYKNNSFSVLFVIGDEYLSEEQMLFIEKWSDDSKPLFFASSPCLIDVKGNWRATLKSNRFLFDALLQKNGLYAENAMILDNSNVRIAMEDENGTYDYLNYPLWPYILKTNLNQNSKITANISSLVFNWPGAIFFNNSANNENVQVLAKTGKSSWKMEEPFETDPYGKFKTDAAKTSFNLAVAVDNNSRTVFVSDEYFFSDAIEWSNSVENLDFISFAVLWLEGEDDLISLQKKVSNPARLAFSGSKEEQQKSILLMWLIPVVFIPILLLVLALFFYMKKGKINNDNI